MSRGVEALAEGWRGGSLYCCYFWCLGMGISVTVLPCHSKTLWSSPTVASGLEKAWLRAFAEMHMFTSLSAREEESAVYVCLDY